MKNLDELYKKLIQFLKYDSVYWTADSRGRAWCDNASIWIGNSFYGIEFTIKNDSGREIFVFEEDLSFLQKWKIWRLVKNKFFY